MPHCHRCGGVPSLDLDVGWGLIFPKVDHLRGCEDAKRKTGQPAESAEWLGRHVFDKSELSKAGVLFWANPYTEPGVLD